MSSFFQPFSDQLRMGETDRINAHIRLYEVHPQGKNKKKLSARLYEFFVNTYSQNTTCIQDGIDLGKDYKEKCLLYQKKNFTYFRRGKNTPFIISKQCGQDEEDIVLQITDHLLRFLDWVAIRRVDEYILQNLDVIMRTRQQVSSTIENETLDLCTTLSGLTIGQSLKKSKSTRSRSKTNSVVAARWHLPEHDQHVFQVRIGC